MPTMKAAVIHEAGGPEVLKVESRPIPTARNGEVLIRVKAFGLNRSELFTRQGHSPGIKLPRVLGIEAVGLVEEVPGNEFRKGDIVATAMGGMGRQFDGGYAEYTCVPATQVQVFKTRPVRDRRPCGGGSTDSARPVARVSGGSSTMLPSNRAQTRKISVAALLPATPPMMPGKPLAGASYIP